MELDSERIDEATEDPPPRLVALSVVGLALAVLGLVSLVLSLVGLDAAIVRALPAVGVVFSLSVPLLIVGAGVFVLSMRQWEAAVDS